MNEEFLRIKRIDTDTVVIPETNNKFEYHRLKDLLDEYYEWRVNKLNKSDVIGSVCNHSWFPTTKDYKRAWKCTECKKVVHDKHLR
jgi:hypothetical protein